MRKIFKLFGIIAVAAVIGFGIAACDDGSVSLDAPSNVRIDADTFTLKWDAVEGASKYEVDISGELFQVSTTQYDLKKLTEKPKLYTLKVKAVAGASESANSAALECEPALYVFTFDNNGGRAAGPAGASAGSTITGLTTYGKTLDTIVIPASVAGINITAIGDEAFKGNTIIVVVIFLSPTPPEVADDAFDGCTNLESVLVPPGLEDDYKDKLPDEIGDIVEEDDSLVDTLTITGLAAWNGAEVNVMVWSRDGLDAMERGDEEYEEPEVYGWGEIENGSVTVSFIAEQWFVTGKDKNGDEEWDYTSSFWSPEAGKNYWVVMSIFKKTGGKDPVYGTDEADYLYTNGQTYNVTLNADFDMIAFIKTVPYFDFSQSSVALSKFWQVPEGMFGSESGGDDPDDPDGKG